MNLVDIGTLPTEARDFRAFLDRIRAELGVEHAAYAGLNAEGGKLHGFVTYPAAWVEHYSASGLADADPALTHARRSIAPVDWSRLPRDPISRRVFRDAADFGVPSTGVTVPVRGPFGDIGMLSVSQRTSPAEWARLSREIVPDLHGMAVHLHDAVMRTSPMGRILRHPQLSRREREVMQWIAAGKTQRDVGDILAISDRTVEVHLRSAREKLQALTTAQAVARAVSFRLIDPV